MTPLLLFACTDVTTLDGEIVTAWDSWTEHQVFDDRNRLISRTTSQEDRPNIAHTYGEHDHPLTQEEWWVYLGEESAPTDTTWTLDDQGRPTEAVTVWAGAEPDMTSTTTWSWEGQTVRAVHSTGGDTTTVYDDQGRILEVTQLNGNGGIYAFETWTWDGDLATRTGVRHGDEPWYTGEEHWEDGRRVYYRRHYDDGTLHQEQWWTWDGDRLLEETYHQYTVQGALHMDAKRTFTWTDHGVAIEGHANDWTWTEDWFGAGLPVTEFHQASAEPPVVCLLETRCAP